MGRGSPTNVSKLPNMKRVHHRLVRPVHLRVASSSSPRASNETANITTEPLSVQRTPSPERTRCRWCVASRGLEHNIRNEVRGRPHLHNLVDDGNRGRRWCPGAGWRHWRGLDRGGARRAARRSPERQSSSLRGGAPPWRGSEEKFPAAPWWIPMRGASGREKN
jgi:hypothetical protein